MTHLAEWAVQPHLLSSALRFSELPDYGGGAGEIRTRERGTPVSAFPVRAPKAVRSRGMQHRWVSSNGEPHRVMAATKRQVHIAASKSDKNRDAARSSRSCIDFKSVESKAVELDNGATLRCSECD